MGHSLRNDFSVITIGVKESDELCLARFRALGNTYGPTDEHKGLLNRVQSQLKKVKAKL